MCLVFGLLAAFCVWVRLGFLGVVDLVWFVFMMFDCLLGVLMFGWVFAMMFAYYFVSSISCGCVFG